MKNNNAASLEFFDKNGNDALITQKGFGLIANAIKKPSIRTGFMLVSLVGLVAAVSDNPAADRVMFFSALAIPAFAGASAAMRRTLAKPAYAANAVEYTIVTKKAENPSDPLPHDIRLDLEQRRDDAERQMTAGLPTIAAGFLVSGMTMGDAIGMDPLTAIATAAVGIAPLFAHHANNLTRAENALKGVWSLDRHERMAHVINREMARLGR